MRKEIEVQALRPHGPCDDTGCMSVVITTYGLILKGKRAHVGI